MAGGRSGSRRRLVAQQSGHRADRLTAASATGQAQGAFETVLKYTGERIVADKPIRQHSIAAGILADMAIGIETARWSYLSAAGCTIIRKPTAPPHPISCCPGPSIAKMHACDVAVSVTNKAMELMGSFGYVRDYDVEKYWRDCTRSSSSGRAAINWDVSMCAGGITIWNSDLFCHTSMSGPAGIPANPCISAGIPRK